MALWSQDAEPNDVVEAARRGDAAALRELWEGNRRWVAAVLLAYKPRSAELEDLLQDVAMTLVGKINTVRTHSNIRAWLRTVAINAARAAGRTVSSRPRVHELEDDRSDERRPSTDSASSSELAHRTAEMVARLPDLYREPLMLKAVHGMRTRQIARILEIDEAAVDTRVSRARRMLREQAALAGIGIDGGDEDRDADQVDLRHRQHEDTP